MLTVEVKLTIHNNALNSMQIGLLKKKQDRDSTLGKFYVCSTVCMNADNTTDLQWLLWPILIFAGLIFALFSFSAK